MKTEKQRKAERLYRRMLKLGYKPNTKTMEKERTVPVNKDQIIQAMKDRILSEHRKYADSDVIDWAFLAAVKIYGSFLQ